MDLSTRYMGLELKSPLIASASPLTGNLGNILALDESGAGAVVLPSLFEEQFKEVSARVKASDAVPETQSYYSPSARSRARTSAYLRLIEKAAAVAGIPVIASMNGTTSEGWLGHARQMEEAGAAAIELNIYLIPTDLSLSGTEVEQRYLDMVRALRAELTIPVAVKLGPYFSAMGHMARQLDEIGANALVLFNRFYQPDIDIGTLRLSNDLSLSNRHEVLLPTLWISTLAGRVRASLAASSGVETSEEVVKYLLAGADVVMTTSALLRFGPAYIGTLRNGLVAWMESHGVETLGAIRGDLSHLRLGRCDPLFERNNYLEILKSRAE